MKKFILTSNAFSGEVEFVFNDADILVSFDAGRAELSEKQQYFILRQMPDHLSDVQRVLGNSKTAKLTELKEDVTFEMFYARYHISGNNDSPKKSRIRWNRMSKTEQYKAYHYITRYEQSIMAGTGRKLAETYLNSEVWNN